MIFQTTPIEGVLVMALDRHEDERGFFARAFCRQEMSDQGIDFTPVQANLSHSRLRGTLRGMHYRKHQEPEAKIIRCIRGSVWDVVLDLRQRSPTRLRHFALEISATNGLAIHIPDGCAHGHQTLTEDCELLYLMSDIHRDGAACGIRYDDPTIGIDWPLSVSCIHPRDLEWPLISEKSND
jgi:dTDP-4-dehydrorhamnose 3,5-epimerase